METITEKQLANKKEARKLLNSYHTNIINLIPTKSQPLKLFKWAVGGIYGKK